MNRTENHPHLMSGYVDDVMREMAQLRGENGESARADYGSAQDYEIRLQQLQAMREKGL